MLFNLQASSEELFYINSFINRLIVRRLRNDVQLLITIF